MANNLFGDLGSSLGGLMKGFSALMPQDDPAVKEMNAQSKVTDLKKKESEIYEQIGRQAMETYGAEAFAELASTLTANQTELAAAEEVLAVLVKEREEREAAAKAEAEAKRLAEEAAEAERRKAMEAFTCPSCGYENPEGAKFCHECGTKLGKTYCVSCGAELKPGMKFCGECGAKQG